MDKYIKAIEKIVSRQIKVSGFYVSELCQAQLDSVFEVVKYDPDINPNQFDKLLEFKNVLLEKSFLTA